MNKVFKANPNLNEYWETTDGKAFYYENVAVNYARSLEVEKRKIKHVEREVEVENIEDEDQDKAPEYDMSMTRPVLNSVAKSIGFDASELETKQDVIDAIDAKINGGSTEETDETKSAEEVEGSADQTKVDPAKEITSDKGAEAAKSETKD